MITDLDLSLNMIGVYDAVKQRKRRCEELFLQRRREYQAWVQGREGREYAEHVQKCNQAPQTTPF